MTNSMPLIESIPTPIRRGPIVTLARLWEAVPIPQNYSDNWLPEPHQTFIETFEEILMRDKWFIPEYDMKRWSQQNEEIVNDQKLLDSLTVRELRDFLTFCYRGNRYCTGYLDGMVREGSLQKVLLRLAVLVGLE